VKISFVILTWNTLGRLKACLGSVYSSPIPHAHEVIVVDNGSVDGTASWVSETYPEVMLIRNSRNLGTSKARNQAVSIARGEYLIFLDSDTVVNGAAIEALVIFMDEHPGVGICGPKLTYPDGRLQYSPRRMPPVYIPLVSRVGFLRKRSKAYGHHLMHDFDHKSVRDVDYLISACIIVRKEFMDRAGGFDENIFYAAEDILLCARCWREGWRVVYYPHVSVVHDYTRLTAGRPLSMLALRQLKDFMYMKHVCRDFERLAGDEGPVPSQ